MAGVLSKMTKEKKVKKSKVYSLMCCSHWSKNKSGTILKERKGPILKWYYNASIDRISGIENAVEKYLSLFKSVEKFYVKVKRVYEYEIKDVLQLENFNRITSTQENVSLEPYIEISKMINESENRINELAIRRVQKPIMILEGVLSSVKQIKGSYMVKINAEKNDEQELLKELVKLYDDFVHSTEMSAGSGSEKRTKDPYVLKQTLLNYRERAVAKKERESKVIERELVRYKDLDKSLYRRIYDAVQLFVAHQMVMDRQSAKKWNVGIFEFGEDEYTKQWESFEQTIMEELDKYSRATESFAEQILQAIKDHPLTQVIHKGPLSYSVGDNYKSRKNCIVVLTKCGFMHLFHPTIPERNNKPNILFSINLAESILSDRESTDLARSVFSLTEKSIRSYIGIRQRYYFYLDSFEEMVKWWDLIHNLQSNGVDDASGKSDQSTNKSTDSTKEKGETENASKDRTEKLEPVSHQNHEKELSGSLRRAPKPLPQPRLKRSGVLNQNDSKVSEEKHVEINKIEKYGHGKSQETLKEPKEDLVHDVSKDHLQKHPNPNSNPNLNPDPSPSLSQLSSSTSSSVSLAALPSSPTSGTQTEKGMDVPTTNSDNRATKNATNRTPAFSQMYTPVYISSQVPINASLPTFQLHPNAALNPNVLGKQAGVRNTKQNGQHIGGHGGLGGFMGIGQPMYAYVNTPVPYPFVVPAPMNIAPRQAYYAPGVVLPQQNYLQPGPGGLSRSNSARYSDGVQISEDLGDNPGLIEVSPNPIIEEP